MKSGQLSFAPLCCFCGSTGKRNCSRVRPGESCARGTGSPPQLLRWRIQARTGAKKTKNAGRCSVAFFRNNSSVESVLFKPRRRCRSVPLYHRHKSHDTFSERKLLYSPCSKMNCSTRKGPMQAAVREMLSVVCM